MASIRHIEFWVKDLNLSLNFYKTMFSILGWQQANQNGFSSEDTKIYFLQQPNLSDPNNTVGPRHICLNATKRDVIDKIAEFAKQNGKIVREPGELHPKDYMVVFKDPGGYIWETSFKSE